MVELTQKFGDAKITLSTTLIIAILVQVPKGRRIQVSIGGWSE